MRNVFVKLDEAMRVIFRKAASRSTNFLKWVTVIVWDGDAFCNDSAMATKPNRMFTQSPLASRHTF
jgi:hypothetical protein